MGTEESYTKQKFFYWCVPCCRLLRARASLVRFAWHGCGAIATASCTHWLLLRLLTAPGAAARVPACSCRLVPVLPAICQPALQLARRPTSQPARNWCVRAAACHCYLAVD